MSHWKKLSFARNVVPKTLRTPCIEAINHDYAYAHVMSVYFSGWLAEAELNRTFKSTSRHIMAHGEDEHAKVRGSNSVR